MIDVVEAPIAALRAALEAARVTAVELVDAYLARIDAYDTPDSPTALNAVVVRAGRRSVHWTASPTPPRTATWSAD